MEITEIRNEFEKELINNGYRFFKDSFKNSLRGIQKRFKDEKGTKYFITAYHYNLREQGFETAHDKDSYSFTSQLRINEDSKDQTIDVTFNADFIPNEYRELTTLKEVEDFFENMFKNINADYYELDND